MTYYKLRMDIWCGWDPAESDLEEIAQNMSAGDAICMVHGPSKGLELLQELDSDPRLSEHHRLYAVRAHLLEMAGNHTEAIANYRLAAHRATSVPERNYLLIQAARLSEQHQPRF